MHFDTVTTRWISSNLYAYIILVIYLSHCKLNDEIFMQMWVFILKTSQIGLCIAFATKIKKKIFFLGRCVYYPRKSRTAVRIFRLLWTIHIFFQIHLLCTIRSCWFSNNKSSQTGKNCYTGSTFANFKQHIILSHHTNLTVQNFHIETSHASTHYDFFMSMTKINYFLMKWFSTLFTIGSQVLKSKMFSWVRIKIHAYFPIIHACKPINAYCIGSLALFLEVFL